MKPILAITILISSLSTLYAYHPEGMKVYKKECMICHGSPFRMAESRKQYDWEQMMFQSSRPILDLHKNEKEAIERLGNNWTDKKQENLFKFLIGNAKDSGAVPGCDGNYCGP